MLMPEPSSTTPCDRLLISFVSQEIHGPLLFALRQYGAQHRLYGGTLKAISVECTVELWSHILPWCSSKRLFGENVISLHFVGMLLYHARSQFVILPLQSPVRSLPEGLGFRVLSDLGPGVLRHRVLDDRLVETSPTEDRLQELDLAGYPPCRPKMYTLGRRGCNKVFADDV